MKVPVLTFLLLILTSNFYGQETSVLKLLNDPALAGGSLSVSIADAESEDSIFGLNAHHALIPASIVKLITTIAGIEILGSGHTFSTQISYSGNLNNKGMLTGDIIITGGGDPAFGSERFKNYYGNVKLRIISAVSEAGIKKIKGNVICDDSYFDYHPVPSEWLWEDIGNYYGAGTYGLSVYDNTAFIHLRSSAEYSRPQITVILPSEVSTRYENHLISTGTGDNAYIFSPPYGTYGWIEGSIPPYSEDFVIKASISDPPLFFARTILKELELTGIKVKGNATTSRITGSEPSVNLTRVLSIQSPTLDSIIFALNHESINLYAEHIIKELGKQKTGNGSLSSGLEVIYSFLDSAGIGRNQLYIRDGSGLSPVNSIQSSAFSKLLSWTYRQGRSYNTILMSLPEPGVEGTLRNYFKDPVFSGRVFMKSGSMSRVQCYAGYLIPNSGRTLSFCIMVNNFTGTNRHIITSIEEILKETILNN